jgi:hypothetical protein
MSLFPIWLGDDLLERGSRVLAIDLCATDRVLGPHAGILCRLFYAGRLVVPIGICNKTSQPSWSLVSSRLGYSGMVGAVSVMDPFTRLFLLRALAVLGDVGIYSIYMAVVNYLTESYEKYAPSVFSAASMGWNTLVLLSR